MKEPDTLRFISAITDTGTDWGLLQGTEVTLLGSTAIGNHRTLGETLRSGDLSRVLDSADGAVTVPLSAVQLLPPIHDAGKIICVGLNYADHIAEMGRARPEMPVIFTRFNDTLVGDGAALIAPRVSEQFDFEGEFTVVLGIGGRHIPVESALDHVLGYTIMNDGSVRDYQRHTHQFGPGKNFPSSGSLGPVLVTIDEFGDVGSQSIQTRVNGTTVQDSTLDQLVFNVAELIAYCSQWTELAPGDLIATGTPGGVGDGHDPKLWLQAGDSLEIEVEGIGTLRNPVLPE